MCVLPRYLELVKFIHTHTHTNTHTHTHTHTHARVHTKLKGGEMSLFGQRVGINGHGVITPLCYALFISEPFDHKVSYSGIN